LEAGGKPGMMPPRWKLEDIIRRGVQDSKQPLF